MFPADELMWYDDTHCTNLRRLPFVFKLLGVRKSELFTVNFVR